MLSSYIHVLTMTSFPVRCFTCGKVIADLWPLFEERRASEDSYEILDDLKIGRSCCRRMFTTHVDINRYVGMYPTYQDRIQRIGPKHKIKSPEEESEDEDGDDTDNAEEDEDESEEEQDEEEDEDEQDEDGSEEEQDEDGSEEEENEEEEDQDDEEDEDE